jgi:hypothetical protein
MAVAGRERSEPGFPQGRGKDGGNQVADNALHDDAAVGAASGLRLAVPAALTAGKRYPGSPSGMPGEGGGLQVVGVLADGIRRALTPAQMTAPLYSTATMNACIPHPLIPVADSTAARRLSLS